MVFRITGCPPPLLEIHNQVLPVLFQCVVGFSPSISLQTTLLLCGMLCPSMWPSEYLPTYPLEFSPGDIVSVRLFSQPFASTPLILPSHVITLLYSSFPYELVNSIF